MLVLSLSGSSARDPEPQAFGLYLRVVQGQTRREIRTSSGNTTLLTAFVGAIFAASCLPICVTFSSMAAYV